MDLNNVMLYNYLGVKLQQPMRARGNDVVMKARDKAKTISGSRGYSSKNHNLEHRRIWKMYWTIKVIKVILLVLICMSS